MEILQVVYSTATHEGIGYDEQGAPVMTARIEWNQMISTKMGYMGYRYAQYGEGVLTDEGWRFVNAASKWTEENPDDGSFGRDPDHDDYTWQKETPRHMAARWLDTAKKTADKDPWNAAIHAIHAYELATIFGYLDISVYALRFTRFRIDPRIAEKIAIEEHNA